MTLALWIGVAIFAVGAGLRIWAARPWKDAWAKRHSDAPRRGALWTKSDDPEIERWRVPTLVGTTLLWAGAIIAIVNPSL